MFIELTEKDSGEKRSINVSMIVVYSRNEKGGTWLNIVGDHVSNCVSESYEEVKQAISEVQNER